VKVLRRSFDSWVDQPLLDYAMTAAAVTCLVAIGPRGIVSRDAQVDLYQTLAGVSGALLGLGTIIVTLLFTVTPNDRLERVIEIVGHRLLRLAMSSLTMLVFTTIGCLALFGLDEASGAVRLGAISSLLAMMVLRFLRLWWLVYQVMRVLVSGMSAPDAEAWVRPVSTRDAHELPRRRTQRSPIS
jgi:hypothetical protein